MINIEIVNKRIIDKVIIATLHIYILIIPFSSGLARLLPILAIILWFFSSYYVSPKAILKEYPIFKYILIFISYIAISLSWSDSVYAGKKEVEDYIYWIILVVFATAVTKENYKNFLISFIVAASASLFISYGLEFNIIEPINKFTIYWYLDSIDYSIYLSIASIIVFYLILYKNYSLKERVVLFIFLTIFSIMLFNSNGRTGQYSFILSAMYLIVSIDKKLKTKLFFMGFLLLFVSLLFTYNQSAHNRLVAVSSNLQKSINKNNFDTSIGVRYITAKIALEASLEKPFFGHGIGDDYAEYIEKIKSRHKASSSFLLKDNGSIAYRPHCQYAFVGYRLGIVGIVLFILMLYKIFKLDSNKIDYDKLHKAIFIILLFSMLFNNILKSTLTTAMFLVFIGIAIGLSRKSLSK